MNSVIGVIDDDLNARQSLCALGRSMNFNVRAYESAEAFLADHVDSRICCLVTDVRLPGISGLQLLELLAEWVSPPPVIVISGRATLGMWAHANAFGAFATLDKPYEHDELADAIRRAVL